MAVERSTTAVAAGYCRAMRLLPLALVGGCATMNGARPLEPGQHAVGVTLGGAVLEFAGAPLPLP